MADVQTPAVREIGVSLCNRIFQYTLHGDYALYYVSAFALSIAGAEEWRARLQGKAVDNNPAFTLHHINYASDTIIDHALKVIVDDETQRIEFGTADFDDEDSSGYYIPSPRDAALIASIKNGERVERVRRRHSIKEQADANSLYGVLVLYVLSLVTLHALHISLSVFLLVFREEYRATLEAMCADIDQIDFGAYTTELLSVLWPKIFLGVDRQRLGAVSTVLDTFMTSEREGLPYGNVMDTMSSHAYWRKRKATLNEAERLASTFALRLVSAGITECVVERVFSHVKWLYGFKRFRLAPETMENLVLLRFAE
jgi:hypothetical protein